MTLCFQRMRQSLFVTCTLPIPVSPKPTRFDPEYPFYLTRNLPSRHNLLQSLVRSYSLKHFVALVTKYSSVSTVPIRLIILQDIKAICCDTLRIWNYFAVSSATKLSIQNVLISSTRIHITHNNFCKLVSISLTNAVTIHLIL